jgi:hypothetical protein
MNTLVPRILSKRIPFVRPYPRVPEFASRGIRCVFNVQGGLLELGAHRMADELSSNRCPGTYTCAWICNFRAMINR